VPANNRKYLEQVAELRAASPGQVRDFRTYQDVLDQFAPDLAEFVLAVVNQHKRLAAASDAERIAARLGHFPTIRSNVRANMYLMFHCLVHKKGAGRDKVGDYRHVAEAAYCEAMVTADRQLAKTAPLINPELRVLRLADLEAHPHTPPTIAMEPTAP